MNSSRNSFRSVTRNVSNVATNVLDSLQIMSPEECEQYLNFEIDRCGKKFMSNNLSHISYLKGARAILWTLLATVQADTKTGFCNVTKSFMSFSEAHEMFLSYHAKLNKSALKEPDQIKCFKDWICNAK